MDDSYYEELIRMEAEQLAVDQFGQTYCDLLASGQLRIRELALDRLGAYEAALSPRPKLQRRRGVYRQNAAFKCVN